ncbi:MAG: hypothetical protein COS42_05420 [Flavobacteriales bacterium CG03_land_8_20_14_0_80_35_15]|nr:hypothetical protein [Zetaproteobacteria bacterium]NCT19431.1 hypothetical protein [Flavobacteriia bacterium]OIO09896.1 MAG: hypothetical protein AUJ53_08075 [Flavobacteriaceae bacterium CG1_02_35_72]PIR14197.1 MAG: hypothetical protein COV50_04140 [Flavobacteriales bacterium CG11_big_fil_rev_8_21_14_0_20_35_7]PIV17317.1 MAG: hypothetical protein COS42_05420 [Flavobacteriales bacterium CG03_land_8_20_14_0_80_35_15]PIX08060.1 MAG: hypothetical protein COZ76_00080 [Flavobacteriales bacterium 
MKAVTIKALKTELSNCSPNELFKICLCLTKFKKENKELLSYLLFQSADEEGFINDLKTEIDFQFTQINSKNYYFIKKSVRKILRYVKSNIRYSKNKETEIELLLYFCAVLKNSKPSIDQNLVLKNIFIREIAGIKKKVAVLHEDLQYDYKLELDKLLSADKV